jgi:hypothetical protein
VPVHEYPEEGLAHPVTEPSGEQPAMGTKPPLLLPTTMPEAQQKWSPLESPAGALQVSDES